MLKLDELHTLGESTATTIIVKGLLAIRMPRLCQLQTVLLTAIKQVIQNTALLTTESLAGQRCTCLSSSIAQNLDECAKAWSIATSLADYNLHKAIA